VCLPRHWRGRRRRRMKRGEGDRVRRKEKRRKKRIEIWRRIWKKQKIKRNRRKSKRKWRLLLDFMGLKLFIMLNSDRSVERRDKNMTRTGSVLNFSVCINSEWLTDHCGRKVCAGYGAGQLKYWDREFESCSRNKYRIMSTFFVVFCIRVVSDQMDRFPIQRLLTVV
jgi:hypothetical protein